MRHPSDPIPPSLMATMGDWQNIADAYPPETRQRDADQAGDLAVRAARLAAYMNARYLGQDHAAGVKAQNRAARELRRALGFTYPSLDIDF